MNIVNMLKTISKSFKFRFFATPEQKNIFSSWAGTCRFLFNLGLEHRILSWNSYQKGVSYVDQANCLKEMKRAEGFEWIKETPAQLLQQSFKDLDRAFQNFFKVGSGFPKYKKRGQKDSFRFPDPKQFTIEKITNKYCFVKLPKIGKVKFKRTRDIEGRIRNATISRDAEHWSISFNCEVEEAVIENNGPMVGIDRGITKTLALSDETTFSLPKTIKEIEGRISALQKRLRLKKKFSENWKKLKKQITKLHQKIARIRHDWLHKISTHIAKNHSYVVIEDLKTKNMSKSAKGTIEEPGKNIAQKSGLNRSILRQGWHKFEVLLGYKCDWNGSYLELVKPHYSSQECSSCGYTSKDNRKSQKEFCCQKCEHEENADINAAKVILTRGQRGSVCGGVEVVPAIEAETTNDACA